MRLAIAAVLLALLPASSAVAGLDEYDKAWVLTVRTVMLDEEHRILESLKTKEDRLEFRKIFWARRDPDLTTTENEFQTHYEARRPEADKRFYTSAYVPVARSTDALGSQPAQSTDPFASGTSASATAAMEEARLRMLRDQKERAAMDGSLTDCGLFYIVLGEPDDIQKRPLTVWGMREPQRWAYKNKGEFLFDEACLLPIGNDKVRRQVREYTITQPTIAFHAKGGELLKKLADMMPKITPMVTLLRTPREDFKITTHTYFLKLEDRTGVFGLVRGDAGALFREDAAGGKVRLLVRVEAAGEAEGAATVGAEREVLADVMPDGAFVASYRLGVKPGRHTFTVGVLDTNSNKGSVLSKPLEAPDYAASTLAIAPILALHAVEEGAKKDARHPMESFRFGEHRLAPRFGHVFQPSDEMTVSYQFYSPATDPATQKSSTVAKVRILRATGSPISEGPDDSFDTPVAGTLVGPVSLAKYPPGKYKIQLKVMDNVAGKVFTQEAAFEVAAPAATASAP